MLGRHTEPPRHLVLDPGEMIQGLIPDEVTRILAPL